MDSRVSGLKNDAENETNEMADKFVLRSVSNPYKDSKLLMKRIAELEQDADMSQLKIKE